MKTVSPYRLQAGVVRLLSGFSAPKGAIIICAYLAGMTGIAAGAYAMRDQIFAAPTVATDIADRLPQPVALNTTPLPMHGSATQHQDHSSDAPRLAALSPSETRLDDDLLSPLSRIFLGQPPLTPPDRPIQLDPWTEIDPAKTPDALEDEAGNPVLSASLRPRQRPEELVLRAPAQAEAELRLASLAAPVIVEEPEKLIVPSTPQITQKAHCSSRLANDMPRRRGSAPGAQTFMASVNGIDGVERDRFLANEILKGNMPRFLHRLVPVSFNGKSTDGRNTSITLCVTPDYLALGSDRDFVRVPLGLRAATRIAEEFNMLLPTPRMVDMIYRQAALRLSPRPMTPGPQMTSTAYFVRHNATVESQRQSAGAAAGTLISGHKKDVVLTSRLASNRGRVAIYGWHKPNGQPIQPLSTVHGAGYADYSHGVRLVSQTAYLNGRAVDLRTLMADPNYAGLVSHEGPLGRAVVASN